MMVRQGDGSCKMSLLGWVVGAALLDEWDFREEEEREKEELRRKNWENERTRAIMRPKEGIFETIGRDL